MSSEQTEQALLMRARAFDAQALAEVYDTFSPAIYRYAMRLLDDAHLAEDCVTETFTRLLGALKANNGPRDYLKAYLFRVAHNWITDHWRANRIATVPLNALEEAQHSHNGTHGAHGAHETTPMQMVFERIAAQHVRTALFALTEDQRQVIVLKFYEDLSNEAVAAAIGKPVGAVKSLQHRALAALKRSLAETVSETVALESTDP